MDKTSLNKRRSFLQWLLGIGAIGWLGSVLYPIVRYLIPPSTPEANVTSIQVGSREDFAVGTGTIFQFGREPGILIRLSENEFRAFAATCTHLSCIVQYRGDLHQIWCACHNGSFDLTGRNIAGPPPRPLNQFDVHLRGDEVWISRNT